MSPRFLLALALLASLPAPPALGAGDPNACDDPSEAPNVIVGDLHAVRRWGNVGGITAFSIGTTSCNVGTCWLNWLTADDSSQHPTIGQNLFRLKAGRIEHVGQSWLKHGFYALSEDVCSPDCIPTDGEHLGVNCSDPYSTDLNAQQTRLGPKFEVNPLTGAHPHPVTDQRLTGDDIFKRLQVHDEDLDPALNPDARYFIEGQYIAEDDAGAGNQQDNASYREVAVQSRDPQPGWRLIMNGETQRTKPGIWAWKDADPLVEITAVHDPQGGRYWVAGRAMEVSPGRWAYEYAVQNLTSERAAREFSVPLPPASGLGSAGFHDVDYHSGEPFDGTDWSNDGGADGGLTWSTATHEANPNANALRWGTLYNFRFECDLPPAISLLSLTQFKPGRPGEADVIAFPFLAPMACNADGTCDAAESCVSCPGECTGTGPDMDGDGFGYCADCQESDALTWSPPGEVTMLLARKGVPGEVLMTWDAPAEPGSATGRFEVLRSQVASDFTTAVACLRHPTDESLLEVADPGAGAAGPLLYYLVRARNACPAVGFGTTGGDSFGVERRAADCP